MLDTLRQWASSFGELHSGLGSLAAPQRDDDQCAYRLRHWPILAESHKTAEVYRVLSVMSSRPVNRSWMLNHSKLPPRVLDDLLHRLNEDNALQVIDISSFRAPAGKR